MDPVLRAGALACAMFLALCGVFFIQPFTGSFLLMALPAAVIATLAFFAVRPASPPKPGADVGPSVAVVIGVLLVLLGLMFAVGRWPMLWDPCHTWADRSPSGSVSPDDPCSSSSSSTQTRGAFLVDSLLGEGLLMAGGVLAMWAGPGRRREVLGVVGAAMLLPTAILFAGMSMVFLVSFLLGVALVVLAVVMRPAVALKPSPPVLEA